MFVDLVKVSIKSYKMKCYIHSMVTIMTDRKKILVPYLHYRRIKFLQKITLKINFIKLIYKNKKEI